MPSASSNFDSVSSDMFSLPFSIFDTYCWVQFIRSARAFCVNPSCFICDSTLTAIFCECRNHDQLSRLHSASSRHVDGVSLWWASRNSCVFFFIFDKDRNNNWIVQLLVVQIVQIFNIFNQILVHLFILSLFCAVFHLNYRENKSDYTTSSKWQVSIPCHI